MALSTINTYGLLYTTFGLSVRHTGQASRARALIADSKTARQADTQRQRNVDLNATSPGLGLEPTYGSLREHVDNAFQRNAPYLTKSMIAQRVTDLRHDLAFVSHTLVEMSPGLSCDK